MQIIWTEAALRDLAANPLLYSGRESERGRPTAAADLRGCLELGAVPANREDRPNPGNARTCSEPNSLFSALPYSRDTLDPPTIARAAALAGPVVRVA